MKFGKKKEDDKKVKVVDRSKKVNQVPKNPSMWCAMHNCSRTSCPKQH